MPRLTIIAGPNSAGKSTLTQSVDFDGRDRLLDPDAFAHALNPMNPSAAAIATGREVLKRIASYLASGVDFAVETTLSGASPMNLISTAKSRGCEIHLVFVGLDSRERCMREYEDGQHGEGITFQMPYVRRRYERALANVPGAIRSADIATFYDNSADKARLILIAKDGIVIWRAVPLPRWVSL